MSAVELKGRGVSWYARTKRPCKGKKVVRLKLGFAKVKAIAIATIGYIPIAIAGAF